MVMVMVSDGGGGDGFFLCAKKLAAWGPRHHLTRKCNDGNSLEMYTERGACANTIRQLRAVY